MDEFKPDSIVQEISSRFIERAKMGWKKYGVNLDRNDLSTSEWTKHLQDELHDAYLYSEKLYQDEQKRNRLLDLCLDYIHNGPLSTEESYEWMDLVCWYGYKNLKKDE